MLTTIGSWIFWFFIPLIVIVILFFAIENNTYVCIIERLKNYLLFILFAYVIGIGFSFLIFLIPFGIAFSDTTEKPLHIERVEPKEMYICPILDTGEYIKTYPNGSYIMYEVIACSKDKVIKYHNICVIKDNFEVIYTDSIEPKICVNATKNHIYPRYFKWLFKDYNYSIGESNWKGTIYILTNNNLKK